MPPADIPIVAYDFGMKYNILRRFTAYGCDVRVCYDGPTALALAESFRPDVYVIDLTMPGMDGDELARLLRERDLNPQPRLVAVTALGDDAARRRTTAAGFDFHLVKPGDPDELANVVADVDIMQGWSTPPVR